MFSPQFLSLWGKKKKYQDQYYWLPLICHLLDTKNIIEYLYQNKFADHSILNLPIDVIGAIGFLHDFGKITPAFQEESLDLPKLNKAIDLPILPRGKKSPHNLAGQALLSNVLSPSLATVIGAHHGIPSTKREAKMQKYAYKNNLGSSKIWQNMRSEALDYIKSITPNFDQLKTIELTEPQEAVLTGLIIAADWLASNEHYFPLIHTDQTFNDININKRFTQSIELWQKEDKWQPQQYSSSYFEKRFGFKPRKLQSEMLKQLTSVQKPGLAIIEAPMGLGKTEIALSLAEDYATKTHKNGIYFALPTRSTATGLYPRIAKWLSTQKGMHGLKLMHSSAQFVKAITMPNVISNKYYKNKLTPLESFGVGTVDQLLTMSLKARHVFLKHLAFSNKVVIIDEIHAYNSYTFAYLKRTLQYLAYYHVPVITLSATLTNAKRQALINAYTNAKIDLSDDSSYPLITYTDDTQVKQFDKFTPLSQRKVQVKILNNSIPDFINNLPKLGTIGVIVNSVDRAQEIARQIKKPHLLLHSRFLSEDRADLEAKIMQLIGKKGIRPNDFVIIGTQVLEQSLDIDFDLMISDLAPMDLLFQRIGRLHRFNIKHKSDPICYITLDNQKINSYLYDQVVLDNTLNILQDHQTLTLPADIASLVQKAYDHLSDEYFKDKAKEEQKALTFMLDKPVNKIDTLDDFLRHGAIDGDKEQVAQMRVRDIKPQLTFVINQDNLPDEDLLKRTIILPRKVVYNPYEFMQNWQNKTVDDLPVIDLPQDIGNYQVVYNKNLGLIVNNIDL